MKEAFRRFSHSMRFIMIATYFAVIVTTLVLMSFYIIGLLSDKLYYAERTDMFAKANIIAQTVSEVWENDPSAASEKFREPADRCLAGTNIRGVVVNKSYTVLYDTNTESEMTGKVFMRDVLRRALMGEQVQMMNNSEADRKMLYTAVPVTINGQISGGVYLAHTVENIDNTIHTIRTSLIMFSVLITLLIGMLSLGVSYIITSPMEEFTAAAKEISKGNFSRRVKAKGSGEIAEMANALNYMCEELNRIEETRRKFVSDASHELKTPMTGIKLICDSLVSTENPDPETVREFMTDMADEVDRLTRIVDRLLVLTKLDAGANTVKMKKSDIRLLTGHIVKKLAPIADERGISISTDYHEALFAPVLMDYDRLYEAIYNVLDNAVKYSPPSSTVMVDVSEKDEWVLIKITDSGPGIPEEARERIFERFYRLDDSRARETGGTGLGLSIAKEAVMLHGGNITVSEKDGGGSIFTIILPLDNGGDINV